MLHILTLRTSAIRFVSGACRLILALTLTSLLHAADDGAKKAFDIPAESAEKSLKLFADQSGKGVLFVVDAVQGIQTNAVQGQFEPRVALDLLVSGTGLVVSLDEKSGAFAVKRTTPSPNAQGVAPEMSRPFESTQKAATNANEQPVTMEQMTVTAEKRAERLQDVPIPETAISAASLVESNFQRLQDYYTLVPGLTLVSNDYNHPQIAIRGITTGGTTNPTVGVTIDDVPIGSSSNLVGGAQVPDLDPSDLARIEVLRGPQGTLYGSNSIGGLLKYVTTDPSTESFSGHLETSVSSIYNGAELGYETRAAVNVPISDTLAVSMSGFTRQIPGYINDPLIGTKGDNESWADGGHFSVLWLPSPSVSVKLSALIQHSEAAGITSVTLGPGFGDLQQNVVPNAGATTDELQAYSATVKAKIGNVDVTSVTGYSLADLVEGIDVTTVIGADTNEVFGVTGTPIVQNRPTYKFTQELRLSSSLWNRVDWLIGGFYNHEDSPVTEDVLAANPTTGQIVGEFLHLINPSTFEEIAGFANLTIHVTNQFDIQLGGRESENKQTHLSTSIGPYVPLLEGQATPYYQPEVDSQASDFTYLVTPSFKISHDLMVYARLATGFEPGGPNFSAQGTPPTYGSSTTTNYEVGVKGDVLDHLFSFDGSLYYIDWKDIQLTLLNEQTKINYAANGGEAKSEGFELSVESRPVKGLRIAAWVSVDEAVLAEALPASSTVYGAEGNRLPNSSRFSGNVSLDEQFPVTDRVKGFVGGVLTYEGNHLGVFRSTAARQYFSPYAETDAHGGVIVGAWTWSIFINNAFDKRGLLYGGLGASVPASFTYTQPRTIGSSIMVTF
jgi:iron complex outermembrane recepter protein